MEAGVRFSFLAISSLLILGFTFFLVWLIVIFSSAAHNLPSISELPRLLDPKTGSLLQPTRFLDRTAQIEIGQLNVPGINRKFLIVSNNQVDRFSPELIQTAIQVLEPGFWSSPGIRFDRLKDSVASTLAEQLVHDLLLWPEPEGATKTLRMRILAIQVMATYGREKTLEWRLNSLYFGHNILGVEQAAQAFFGKSASQVDLAESSLLIAISSAPALNPWDAPEQAKLLQEQLLTRIYLEGGIGENDYLQAKSETLNLVKGPSIEPTLFSGFTDLLASQMDRFFANNRLARGGFSVVTTLDVNLQEQSACVLQARLAQLEMKPNPFSLTGDKSCQADHWLPILNTTHSSLTVDLAGSVVILDPQTGQVLSLLGDETLGLMGKSLQAHSPGSTLTPFIATVAFSRGFSPASLLWDVPSPTMEGVVTPSEAFTSYLGPLRFRTALGRDILQPLIQVQQQVGENVFWKLIDPFGIPNLAQSSSNSFIYSGGFLSPLRLAQAYSVFANLGSMVGWHPDEEENLSTIGVINVLDSKGEPFWSPSVEAQSVLSSQLAYLVHDVLSSSQGWQSEEWLQLSPPIKRPAGMKLSSTVDGQNTWAVGYTPQRLAVVWLGLLGASGSVRLEPQDAGDIWQTIMVYAHENLPVMGWNIPVGVNSVTVCDPSGMLPTDACPQTVQEVFLKGTEPTRIDTLYYEVSINRETGRLATVYTSPALVEKKVFMNIPPEARMWASTAGIPFPPTEYDQIPATEPNRHAHIIQPVGFSVVSGKVQIRGAVGGDDFKQAWVEVGQGINPTAWSKPGSTFETAVSDAVLATWDTQGLEGLYAIQLIVLHQDQTFDSSIIQVTVDNTAPLISSLYPKENDVITISGEEWIVLMATASDNISINRVEWWLDGSIAGLRYLEPFTLPTQIAPGQHTLMVRVYDSAGNLAQTDSFSFEIKQ